MKTSCGPSSIRTERSCQDRTGDLKNPLCSLCVLPLCSLCSKKPRHKEHKEHKGRTHKEHKVYILNGFINKKIIKMNLRPGTISLLIISFFAVLSGCRKWDDHVSISDPSLKENLYQKMKAMTELSKFNELLVKTGYDTVLSSARLFTVWAPDNQALASLDPAVVNDNNRLRLFVANHIGFEEVYSTAAARVKTLNGKFINVSA